MNAWRDPFDPELYDRVGGSYQLAQSLFAQADGGVFGAGFGQALLRSGDAPILPAAQTDFIYAVIVSTFHGTQSAWAASLALVILMVPTVLRSTEEMLKLVPDSLREASYALGVSKWRTIFNVVLPTSISGVLTGIVLGLARVLGETAPLMVLVQYNTTFADGP